MRPRGLPSGATVVKRNPHSRAVLCRRVARYETGALVRGVALLGLGFVTLFIGPMQGATGWGIVPWIAAGITMTATGAITLGRRQGRAWRRLAETLHLTPEHGAREWWSLKPLLKGSHRRYPLRLWVRVTGSSKNRTEWTVIDLEADAIPEGFGLRLTNDGLGAKLAKLAGGEDAQFGHDALDARFRVETTAPDLLPRLARGTAGPELLRLDPPGEVVIDGRYVSHIVRGYRPDVEHVRSRLAVLGLLARELEELHA